MLLGERIRRLRRRAGLTQVQLGTKIDCSQQLIQRIESGSIKNSLIINQIANYFNVDVIWLQHGKGLNPFSKERIPAGHIPIIDPKDVYEWVSAPDSEKVKYIDIITSPNLDSEKRYYALRINDMSMLDDLKLFKPDNLIIVDPTPLTKDIKTGDYLVFGIPGIQEAVLRKMAIRDNKVFLEPLNLNYDIQPMPKNFLLFGVVVEVRIQIRKS